MIIGVLPVLVLEMLSKLVINTIKLDSWKVFISISDIALCSLTFSFMILVGGNAFLAIYICAVLFR